jgi:excisionase family DNA binding protein
MMNDRLLNRREVCQLLGVGNTTFGNMVRSGQFAPGIRLGYRTVKWRLEYVHQWMASQQTAAA